MFQDWEELLKSKNNRAVTFFFFYSRLINCKKLACLTAFKNISTLKSVYKNPLKLSLMQEFTPDTKRKSIICAPVFAMWKGLCSILLGKELRETFNVVKFSQGYSTFQYLQFCGNVLTN